MGQFLQEILVMEKVDPLCDQNWQSRFNCAIVLDYFGLAVEISQGGNLQPITSNKKINLSGQ